jgi:hypothetical protein
VLVAPPVEGAPPVADAAPPVVPGAPPVAGGSSEEPEEHATAVSSAMPNETDAEKLVSFMNDQSRHDSFSR